ncbi:MAG: CvpA family protein [Phycisphaeraceae bacterium]
MLANVLIILFLALMAYWWGVQGFFSALLHLLLVIVCGAIAFALWEPLAEGLLLPAIGQLAWGVALLGPFALLLIISRTVMDMLVRKNVQFSHLINLICGGVCGLLAAVLTAGIVLIGLGFMPLSASLAGYQPLAVNADGTVGPNPDSRLWVRVDHHAAGFFTRVSGGAFYPWSGHPMTLYRPDLAHQAALFRMSKHYDENASLIATHDSVRVGTVYAHETPLEGLPAPVAEALNRQGIRNAGKRIVIVDTEWQKKQDGTFDSNTLRIAPTQIRLITHATQRGHTVAHLHPPVGFARTISRPKTANEAEQAPDPRRFTPIDNGQVAANDNRPQQKIAWVFVVPTADNETPRFIQLRSLRFDLPKSMNTEPAAVIAAIGAMQVEQKVQPDQPLPSTVGTVGRRRGSGPPAGHKAERIVRTDTLPRSFSKNRASGFRFVNSAVHSGSQQVPPTEGHIGQKTKVDSVYHSDDFDMVRLQVEKDLAMSTLGAAITAAKALQPIWLEDNFGDKWYPLGYVLLKDNGTQRVNIDPDNPIMHAKQLPFWDMGANDEMYLYFAVRKGITITSYNIGQSDRYPCNLVIPD